jgi:hypothetical protein
MLAPRRQLDAYDRETLQAINDRRLGRNDPEARALLQQLETPSGTQRKHHSDIYILSDEEQAQSDALSETVYAEYPKMRQYPFRFKDSRDTYAQRDIDRAAKKGIDVDALKYPGQLEFYLPDDMGPPGETFQGNPFLGWPTVELFKPLAGKDPSALLNPIMGDMLHYLPAVDSTFAELREKFRKSITDEQLVEDEEAHQRALDQGDNRSFEDWFEMNRLDAYIRGLLFPDENDEWKDVYTKVQREIGEEIQRRVEGQFLPTTETYGPGTIKP